MPKYNSLIQSLKKPEKDYCIYSLIDPDTNEIKYIGQTCQGFERIREHFYKCNKRNKTTNQKSLSKIWIYNLKKQNKIFKVEYLEYTNDLNLLNELEIKWISYFTNLGIKLLNHELGGNRSKTLTEEDRKIISERTKLAMNNPEIKQKCRDNIKKQREMGLKMSPISCSEQTKLKISKAQDSKVWIFEDEFGNKLRGTKIAANYFECSPSALQHLVKGRVKTVHGKIIKFYKLNEV